MAEHAGAPQVELFGDVDEFVITPSTEDDGRPIFVSGSQKPGSLLIETLNEDVYHIAVGKDDVTLQGLKLSAEQTLVPAQDPIHIANGGLFSVVSQARGRRSKQAAHDDFFVSTSGGILSIVSEGQPLRIIAPAGYLSSPSRGGQ